jgi:hypothetical protein
LLVSAQYGGYVLTYTSDWLLVAWIFFIGFQVIAFKLETLPLGVHQWDLRIGKAIENAKVLSLLPIHFLSFPLTMVQFFHFTVGIYAIVIIPLKVAIILQIRRIFTPLGHSSRSQRTLRWIVDLFLVLNVIFYLTLVLFQFLEPVCAGEVPLGPLRYAYHLCSHQHSQRSDPHIAPTTGHLEPQHELETPVGSQCRFPRWCRVRIFMLYCCTTI